MPVYPMGGRHPGKRRHVCPAGKKEAQAKIGLDPVCRGRRYGKPDKPPQKEPKRVLFGKKKRHTLKTQVIIERNSLEIIDVQEAKGSEHDFNVYKETIGKRIGNSIPLDADLGYLGIKENHSNSFIPIKSSKNHKQTKKEKAYNKKLAVRGVVIEHINGKIKTFKSMAYPYRGHCRNRHPSFSYILHYEVGAISMPLPAHTRLPVAPPSPITARETLSAFR
jgi:hypothetical protein